jgi:hypothetical protein
MTETRYVIQRKHKVTGEVEYASGPTCEWWFSDLGAAARLYQAEAVPLRLLETSVRYKGIEYTYSVVPVDFTFEIKLKEEAK